MIGLIIGDNKNTKNIIVMLIKMKMKRCKLMITVVSSSSCFNKMIIKSRHINSC